MKRIIISLAFVCVCIVLSAFSNNVEADVVKSEKQLRVEVKKNLLSILAKGVNAKEVAEEIARKSHLKIKVFEGVQDKEVSLNVSDIPVYDVEALLKKVGYDNVAVVYDKTAKAVSAYVLPKGMDASVFVKDNPVIRQANSRAKPVITASAGYNGSISL